MVFVETLLFTCVTALVLCFLVSLGEDLMNPSKRRASFFAKVKSRSEQQNAE